MSDAQEVTIDDVELEAQGYEREMPRQFSLFSLMALSYALLATWNGFGSAMGIGLNEAGAAGTIYSLIIAAVLTGTIAVGMAELASAYPTAGAQYYWSFMVSSPEWAPFASYLSASVSTLGWWLGLGSVCQFIAAMILGMVKLCHDDYVVEDWHTWLCYVGVIWTACTLVIVGSRILPAFNSFMMYFSFVALIATFVTILACAAPNYQSGAWVFSTTTNATGWKSDGFAFVLAILNALYGFLGVDSGAHMCEEIPNPTVNVPKVIVYPVIIGFVSTLPFSIGCMYVITDLDAVLNTDTGLPLMELYYQATGSKAATVVLMSAFAVCMFGAACANITSSSRQMWAASRDNCYPFSKYWKQIHPKWHMPRNVVCLTGTLVSLYGLIFLGSSTVFSSMVGACIVFMTTSYVIPQGILAWRGRKKILPERPLNLGGWGLPVNVLACAWVVGIDVLFCFPPVMPVTKNNMNWISVVTVGLCSYIFIAWHVSQKKVFKGPRVDLPRLRRLREETRRHKTVVSIEGASIDEVPVERSPGKVSGTKEA
ncbi:hypothetical protein PV08_10493 [Exophiala spinifera]|uniref:Amino acid permease/ SLC12A domain-containing protein n=1 Tax=Exophiala spinifera TaxID=91928 RepID=A0A0D2AWW2_9EURO|nr:uncharacterized protein PV08_10493 [Exophiala spinifera]KIW11193.1 hypothetical protein PV08_10493 [Exophiala spinifera]